MNRVIYDCEQGTPEWFQCRMAVPTASELDAVCAKPAKGGVSKTRQTYMRKLAGEVITGEPMESFTNHHMERGKVMEEEARDHYAFEMGVELQQVGFIKIDDIFGASPDSLVGDDGMVEVKTKLPHLQIEVLLKNEIPSTHMKQLLGQLWAADREWVKFVSYWPHMPTFIKRLYRKEVQSEINDIEKNVLQFNAELNTLVTMINKMKEA